MLKHKYQQVSLLVLFIFTCIGLLDYFVPDLGSSYRLLYIFIFITLVSLGSFLVIIKQPAEPESKTPAVPEKVSFISYLLVYLLPRLIDPSWLRLDYRLFNEGVFDYRTPLNFILLLLIIVGTHWLVEKIYITFFWANEN